MRLLKFLKLPFGKKLLLLEILFLVVAVRLGLWLLPFKLIQRLLIRFEPRNAASDATNNWETINEVVEFVRVCSLLVPTATCLTQALVTMIMLRAKRQVLELKIGVAKSATNQFEAHAWIEAGGRIVIGKVPNHRRFKIMNSVGNAIVGGTTL